MPNTPPTIERTFLDNFHTVPVNGDTMYRNLKDNKKMITYKNANNELVHSVPTMPVWTKFYENKNTKLTPLMAVICKRDLIGIDIDDAEIYAEFMALYKSEDLSSYTQYIAHSLPRDIGKGGHIFFKWDETQIELLKDLRKHLGKVKVDVQLDKILLYLATEANKTKELVSKVQEIKPSTLPPLSKILMTYLQGLAFKSMAESKTIVKYTNAVDSDSQISKYSKDLLGYILEEKTHISSVHIRRLTPKADYPKVSSMNDIPDGSGNDWLLKVRTKLSVDESISAEVMTHTILALNKQWERPMNEKILLNMIEKDIKSDFFTYDSKWKDQGVKFFNKNNMHTMEVVFSKNDNSFLLINRTTGRINRYYTFANLADVILAEGKKKVRKDDLLMVAPSADVINTPKEIPYLSHSKLGELRFNTYVPSRGTEILRNPDEFITGISCNGVAPYPHVVLSFLLHLTGERYTANEDGIVGELGKNSNTYRLLQWMKRKFTTFDYTPLVFIFSGVSGAGKGMFIDYILAYFSGATGLVGVSNNDLLNTTFNGYLSGGAILKVDEIGEGHSDNALAKIVGTIKDISGSPTISVQLKGKEKQTVENYTTFFATTNEAPKLVTTTGNNDRRNIYFDSPMTLESMLPFTYSRQEDGQTVVLNSTHDLLREIMSELDAFSYYLSNVDTISQEDYTSNTNWKDSVYQEKVIETLSPIDKFIMGCEDGNINQVIDSFKELGVPNGKINEMFFSVQVRKREASSLLIKVSDEFLEYSVEDCIKEFDIFLPRQYKTILSALKGTVKRSTLRGSEVMPNAYQVRFTSSFVPLPENVKDIVNTSDYKIMPNI